MSDRFARRLAWSIWLLSVALVGPTLFFQLTRRIPSTDIGLNIAAPLIILSYSTVGALIASRHRSNLIGWLLLVTASGLALSAFAEGYAIRGLVDHPGSLPGATAVAWLNTWVIIPAAVPIPLVILLFPTGRVPGPRWRLLPWALAIGGLAGVAGDILRDSPLDVTGIQIANPTGVKSLGVLVSALLTVSGVAILAASLACVAGLALRFRRSQGEERQQLRWLVYAAGTAGVLLIGGFVAEGLGTSSVVSDVLFNLWVLAVGIGIPAAAAVSILRYRLYDLDIVVKKTVVFGVLVALFTVVYVAVVVGIGTALGGTDAPVLTLLAAVIVAIAFQPVRERARRLADRVAYGKRASPYEVLSQFAERVGSAYASEDVLQQMAQILAGGTGARRSEVWLRVGDEIRRETAWPVDAGTDAENLVVEGEELPAFTDGPRPFAVRHQGELLGALAIDMPPSEPLTPSQSKLVEDLASQAGLVLRNVRLIEELRASRERLVRAQDEERRRLERNIHDGAQQQMVAMAVKVNLAESLAARQPGGEVKLLAELKQDLQDALENLRDLARGIYPPLLADQGLAAALSAQGRKSVVPVSVSTDGIGRYTQDVEAAVYFCCLEALQNVAKYANASGITVSLAQSLGELTFEVQDDGVGFDAARTKLGSGLQNMTDRLSALGGSVEVRSRPGEGTRVAGRIPIGENGPLPRPS